VTGRPAATVRISAARQHTVDQAVAAAVDAASGIGGVEVNVTYNPPAVPVPSRSAQITGRALGAAFLALLTCAVVYAAVWLGQRIVEAVS
jgi:hypothetical protein